MLLADELYFVAHDDTTGKPRLRGRATDLALAGALLAELVLFERITIQGGALDVIDRKPPEDALAHTTLDQIVAEQQHRAVRTWLAFLGQSARTAVAQRLLRTGHLRLTETRRAFRTVTAYVPADMSAAAWPETRLRHVLSSGKPITMADATLAGLVGAAGLTDRFLWDADTDTRRYYNYAVESLPSPLRELVANTEAAVGDAVLSSRA